MLYSVLMDMDSAGDGAERPVDVQEGEAAANDPLHKRGGKPGSKRGPTGSVMMTHGNAGQGGG